MLTRLVQIIYALGRLITGLISGRGISAPCVADQSTSVHSNLGTADCGRSSRCLERSKKFAALKATLSCALALLLALSVLIPVKEAQAAPEPGERITNIATSVAGASQPFISNPSWVMVRSPAQLDIMRHAPGSAEAELYHLLATEYSDSVDETGDFTAIDEPLEELGNPLKLIEADSFPGNSVIFFRLTDLDQNLDPTVRESVFLTVSIDASGDEEFIRIYETAPNSGVFIGYLPSEYASSRINSAGVPGDGQLQAPGNSNILAEYEDIYDQSDVAAGAALFDPLGRVFDSFEGTLLDGVLVTLIDTSTNAPAAVFSNDVDDDGRLCGYPSMLLTGSVVIDDCGNEYPMVEGGFQFPRVYPGGYRVSVIAPQGYASMPSVVPFEELQTLPNAPWDLHDPASLGGEFFVDPGPAFRVDIPLDPQAEGLWLQKSADRDIVAIGDFLAYRLTLENNGRVNSPQTVVTDHLPRGFRYQQGSFKLDDTIATDPEISADGRTLNFAVGDIAAGSAIAFSYVVEIAAGTENGDAINNAIAKPQEGELSNLASATVKVIDDFMRDKSILIGTVFDGGCEQADESKPGLADVRLYLEDGTYVITDEKGRFHIEGLDPGVHVLQLDLDSLPAGYQALTCGDNTSFSGRSFSQFVDLQGGTLWRTDFYAQQVEGAKTTEHPDTEATEMKQGQQSESATTPPGDASTADATLGQSEQLSAEVVTAKAEAPVGITLPADGAHLPDRTQSIRTVIDSRLTPKLSVDGVEISNEQVGFERADAESGKTIRTYTGIDLGARGEHSIRLQGLDPFGNARFDQTITVIRTGEVNRIRFADAPENVADGKTPVRVRLSIEDSAGEQILAPLKMSITSGNLVACQDENELEESEQEQPQNLVSVDKDGYACFEPVNSAGRYHATLMYDELDVEVESWVKPMMRDWILVGFAEGTAGYNTFSGNEVSLDEADIDEHFYYDGEVKFFAKGAIKGEWLLTLAYDSDKPNLDGDELFQQIDPDSYYPLYQDQTRQGYEASSASDIFVKLEREQFYALFGDMRTDLTQTVLSRYSRSMNGFKSELQSEHFDYTVFAAETKQAFIKDEIRGDGTSGRYHLSADELVVNSEEIVIEVRDRFHSERILDSTTLTRHRDYDIDYDDGSLLFKEPIASKDDDFNPIFIVARYETLSSDDNLNYGGRAAIKLLDKKVEIGASYIHEERGDDEGELVGVDATIKLTPQTELHLEAASSDTTVEENDQRSDAYLAEVRHDGDRVNALAYFREQEEGFGLGQQNASEAASRKYGAEALYNVTPKVSLSAQAYHEDLLSTSDERDVAQLDGRYKTDRYSVRSGIRQATDRFDDGETRRSTQWLLGGDWLTPDRKLKLRADYEQSLGSDDENSAYPTLLTLGADYEINKRVSVFAEQEFSWGDLQDTEGTRVGLSASPWKDGDISTSVTRQINENGERVYALFGLGQRWQITQNWSIDASLDRSYTVKHKDGEGFNDATPPAHGSDDDFTSVSLGATYERALWSWQNRIETRQADSEDKYGLISSVVGEPQQGLAVSARAEYFINDLDDGAQRSDGNIRLGLAYRPMGQRWTALDRRWTVLDRLDLYFDRQKGDELGYNNWRLVNNLHANYRASRKWQSSLYCGMKYVKENISGQSYDGFTDLYATESRYNITPRWDIGGHGSVLHSWNSHNFDYSAGASVGYSPMTNTWVSLGYNLIGFEDDDFSTAHYTAQGAFIRFRVKFDQQSVRDVAEWVNQ